MEITFGNEKKIIITGPNGSGKTSLLRHITHPLSSHNRYNRLKKGVDDGYKELHITYNKTEYVIKHTYTKTKTAPKVSSYLFKKVDNKMVNLVENGLPTTFKSIVEYELDYYDDLFDVCNIGSHNRGIIEHTSVNKLEYIKKVTRKDEILTEIKNRINNRFLEYQSNHKYVSNELSKFEDEDELKRKIKLLDTESLKLSKDRDNLQKELSTLENTDVSSLEELRIMMKNKSRSIHQIQSVKTLIEDTIDNKQNINKVSLSSLKDDLFKVHTTLGTKLTNNESRITKLNENLVNLKDINNEDLTKEKLKLEKNISDIKNLYKEDKYPEISDSELYSLKNSLDNMINVLDRIENIEHVKDVIKRYPSEEEYTKETNDLISSTKDEYTAIKKEIASLNFTPLLSVNSPDIQLSTKTLRDVYEDQASKVKLYGELTKKEAKLESKLSQLDSEIEYMQSIWDNVVNLKDISVENIDKFTKKVFPDYISMKETYRIQDMINNTLIYNKNIVDLNTYTERYQNIVEILNIEQRNSKEKRADILDELEVLEEENKNLKSNYLLIDNKLQSLISKDDFMDEVKTLAYDKIHSFIEKLNKEITTISEKISVLENVDEKMKEINSLIFKKNTELKDNTEAYYSYKQSLENSIRIKSEFNVITEELNKIKIIKNIVSKSLAARILESYLLDITRIVNSLLLGIMRIRFDVSEGVEIICTIDASDRLSSELSQGEKSMLSVALLVAFKKLIKWDIISIDEGSAALDEDNKHRYLEMITRYIETVPTIAQIFIVSHDFFVSDGMDIKIINLN